MTDRLFVYGTLRRDAPGNRSSLLGSDADFLGHARMRGRLLDLGSFPGFLPAMDGHPEEVRNQGSRSSVYRGPTVRGEVYALGDPSETLTRLDRYEGCGPRDPEPHPFERVERATVLDDGGEETAWVYAYRGPSGSRSEIPSGDYLDVVG